MIYDPHWRGGGEGRTGVVGAGGDEGEGPAATGRNKESIRQLF